jgi:LPS-assembly lipoprotein
VLVSLLGLAGCGFAPIYGEGQAFRDTIVFEANDSVAGFRLRERLEDRLGRSTAPRFRLRVNLSSSQRAAAITADGDTARFNIIGTASWTLFDMSTGDRLEAGSVQAFTSYATTSSTIATQSTKDDAGDRLSVILADMIVSRLLSLNPEQFT